MSIPYWKRQEAIKKLFEYEEKNNIPANQRLTVDPYANIPEILEASPRKKGYVDIREIIEHVKNI